MGIKVDQFVPKVHPASRSVEPEDPMELCATALPGDSEFMLRCVVQEYAWMGWNAEQMLDLFRDPFYPALHALLQSRGEQDLRDRIESLLKQLGVFQFKCTLREEGYPPEAEVDVVQIFTPSHLRKTVANRRRHAGDRPESKE